MSGDGDLRRPVAGDAEKFLDLLLTRLGEPSPAQGHDGRIDGPPQTGRREHHLQRAASG
ncbi:hypothetical protein [Aeromicrobium sp.]|uniref:hypothetical protein n=1 Tax=Aeromicrobium sp. TaxID=1871063 RepID=UPI0019BAF988|nr:hypothetical protein [Aeromicrobium sp.]MBC7632517.1 hypothetical protein [Aeromicrobium sp.]